MSAHSLARLATDASTVAFVVCAAALVACSVVREAGEGRPGAVRRRAVLFRVVVALALLSGAVAGVATVVRIFASAYDS